MMEYQLLGVSIWLGLVLLVAELVARFSKADHEISRKIVHIGVGNVIVLAWWLKIPAWVGISAAVIASMATLASYWYPLLMSVSEPGRKSLGTFFYSVSIGVLIAYFWPLGHPVYAVLGVLVMTWGDGLAALIGQRFGTHRYQVWGITKSWEGTSAMAITSLIVSTSTLLSVYGLSWPIAMTAVVVAVIATGLEAFSKFGIDNLTVPLGSAFVSYGLMHLCTYFYGI